MKRTFLLLMVILFTSVGFAQRKKIHFQSINTISIIGGDSPAKAGFGSTNGFVFSSWFTGIGAAFDYYHFKSNPVFVEERKYFGNQSQIFIYADVGVNLAAQRKAVKEFYDYTRIYYSGGRYAAAGIGCLFPLVKKTSLLLSIGNSYKAMGARTIIDNTCPEGNCAPSYRNYQFEFYSLVVKAGLVF